MPCWLGILPVNMLARAGEHTGEAQKEFSNLIPFRASPSMFGVLISEFPAHPIAQNPKSSARTKTMLGRSTTLMYLLPHQTIAGHLAPDTNTSQG